MNWIKKCRVFGTVGEISRTFLCRTIKKEDGVEVGMYEMLSGWIRSDVNFTIVTICNGDLRCHTCRYN